MTLPKPRITEPDVHAVRAVVNGEATREQQIRAMQWIGEQGCQLSNSPYVPDASDRETFIMLGRQQVGIMIGAMNTEFTLKQAQADDRARQSAAVREETTPRTSTRQRQKP